MFHEAKLTKRDERHELQKLREARGKLTPDRTEPAWVVNYWTDREGAQA